MESVPVSLRGELSRWLIEPKAGVFVGNVNALIRDTLWELCCTKLKEGGVTQIYKHNNEQGFLIRQYGETSRIIEDFEGINLVKVPN